MHAELDNAIRRQPEERCRANRIARHEHEQLLAPDCHALPWRHDDRLPPEEIRYVVRIDIDGGLAISRGLLAAEGGRIWGENADGEGARFTIVVPGVGRAVGEET
jgi:hypothetical protein